MPQERFTYQNAQKEVPYKYTNKFLLITKITKLGSRNQLQDNENSLLKVAISGSPAEGRQRKDLFLY